jgi:hypothetical protein
MRRSYNKNSLPLLFSHGAHDPRYNNENFSKGSLNCSGLTICNGSLNLNTF